MIALSMHDLIHEVKTYLKPCQFKCTSNSLNPLLCQDLTKCSIITFIGIFSLNKKVAVAFNLTVTNNVITKTRANTKCKTFCN